MTPKCRECEHFGMTRYINSDRYFQVCDKAYRKVADTGEELPRTSPRWCPKRRTNNEPPEDECD